MVARCEFVVVAGKFNDDGSIDYKYISPVFASLAEAEKDFESVKSYPFADIEAKVVFEAQ